MDNPIAIDKNKTALVVIDLQNGIAQLEGKPYPAADVIEKASRIAAAFRKNVMPVFLIRVTPSSDMKDSLRPDADQAMSFNQPRPADWAEIVKEMGPEQGDFVITKRQWGAFYGTELDLQLRRRGIDTIVLCGIATNIGVESTARYAFELGYNQIFAEDAMTSMSAEAHEFTIKNTFPRIGKVRKTEDVLASLV